MKQRLKVTLECGMGGLGEPQLQNHPFSIRSDQIRSVAQSCPTLCDPMNCSMPGLPVHHQLPAFSSCVVPGKSILPFEVRGTAGDCSRVTSGQMRPHLCLCLGLNVPLQGRQGSRGCIPDSPEESGLVYRGSKEFRSPLESQRVSLEPTEWPKGSQASCGV